jgi:hypothetical protein
MAVDLEAVHRLPQPAKHSHKSELQIQTYYYSVRRCRLSAGKKAPVFYYRFFANRIMQE